MYGKLQDMRRLEVHKALLGGGEGGSVRDIARLMKVAPSYAFGLLKRLVEAGEVDRVEVTRKGKHCVVYYSRWSEEIYENEAYSLIARVF